jgi:hypothetical protein
MVPVLLLMWAVDSLPAQTPTGPPGSMGPQGQPGQARAPLGFLKRALEQAGAPALTSQQETDLNALITSFRATVPAEPDELLRAAHDAYAEALIAGDVAVAEAQATIIAGRQAQLTATRLTTEAKFLVSMLSILKTGGQLDALIRQFDDRVIGVVRSLLGPGGPWGGPGGPGARPFPSGQ